MRAPRVLYTSSGVRSAITTLMADASGKRVVVTAFVGEGAAAFLPRPKGIHLICWPHPGATSPDALRDLIRRGANVRFADRLHMKVYWSEHKGAVITSANLSTNALGAGDLREAGVLLPPGALDIDRLLGSLKTYPVTATSLRKLDRAHKRFLTGKTRIPDTAPARTFSEWYALPSRPLWKLGVWQTIDKTSSAAKQKSSELYGVSSPDDFIGCRAGQYSADDWILTFRSSGRSVSDIHWMYVTFIVRVPRSERGIYDPTYPYQAVQVHPLRHYPRPPFAITPAFKKAFDQALREFGLKKVVDQDITKPPIRLLTAIQEELVA